MKSTHTHGRGAVETTCYGDTRAWPTRAEAIAYFTEGMYACDGSEAERYARIVGMLKDGCDHAYDEVPRRG